jgi:hypothetical protein
MKNFLNIKAEIPIDDKHIDLKIKFIKFFLKLMSENKEETKILMGKYYDSLSTPDCAYSIGDIFEEKIDENAEPKYFIILNMHEEITDSSYKIEVKEPTQYIMYCKECFTLRELSDLKRESPRKLEYVKVSEKYNLYMVNTKIHNHRYSSNPAGGHFYDYAYLRNGKPFLYKKIDNCGMEMLNEINFTFK